jgi:hypothetical protein
MKRCISVSFDFKGKEYYAIVRHREADSKTFYRISIMDHKLDALLNKGNFNIIEEVDGTVVCPGVTSEGAEVEIRAKIARELVLQLKQQQPEQQYTFIKDFKLLTPN